jgi:hypothetical protein
MVRRFIRDGLAVGFIAYVAVAAFYGVFDLLASRGALYTVDLLGKAVFRDLRDPSVLQFPVTLDPAAIFWYNTFHLVVSLAIGVAVTVLVIVAERRPPVAPLVMSVIVAAFVVLVVTVGILTTPIRSLLPWWSIVAANVLAAVAAGVLLLRRHPIWRLAPGAPGPVPR